MDAWGITACRNAADDMLGTVGYPFIENISFAVKDLHCSTREFVSVNILLENMKLCLLVYSSDEHLLTVFVDEEFVSFIA